MSQNVTFNTTGHFYSSSEAKKRRLPLELIKVLIVESQPLYRKGLLQVLAEEPSISVLGEAQEGKEAVQKTKELRPDVIILNTALPKTGALEAIERIVKQDPQIGVIILTTGERPEEILAAVRLGVRGFLLTDSTFNQLLEAITQVSQGGAFMSSCLCVHLLEHLKMRLQKEKEEKEPQDKVTPREREVLQLLAKGYTTKEIASTLSISERTAKNHIGNVLRKLEAKNRTQAATMAIKEGIV